VSEVDAMAARLREKFCGAGAASRGMTAERAAAAPRNGPCAGEQPDVVEMATPSRDALSSRPTRVVGGVLLGHSAGVAAEVFAGRASSGKRGPRQTTCRQKPGGHGQSSRSVERSSRLYRS